MWPRKEGVRKKVLLASAVDFVGGGGGSFVKVQYHEFEIHSTIKKFIFFNICVNFFLICYLFKLKR